MLVVHLYTSGQPVSNVPHPYPQLSLDRLRFVPTLLRTSEQLDSIQVNQTISTVCDVDHLRFGDGSEMLRIQAARVWSIKRSGDGSSRNWGLPYVYVGWTALCPCTDNGWMNLKIGEGMREQLKDLKGKIFGCYQGNELCKCTYLLCKVNDQMFQRGETQMFVL